ASHRQQLALSRAAAGVSASYRVVGAVLRRNNRLAVAAAEIEIKGGRPNTAMLFLRESRPMARSEAVTDLAPSDLKTIYPDPTPRVIAKARPGIDAYGQKF